MCDNQVYFYVRITFHKIPKLCTLLSFFSCVFFISFTIAVPFPVSQSGDNVGDLTNPTPLYPVNQQLIPEKIKENQQVEGNNAPFAQNESLTIPNQNDLYTQLTTSFSGIGSIINTRQYPIVHKTTETQTSNAGVKPPASQN